MTCSLLLYHVPSKLPFLSMCVFWPWFLYSVSLCWNSCSFPKVPTEECMHFTYVSLLLASFTFLRFVFKVTICMNLLLIPQDSDVSTKCCSRTVCFLLRIRLSHCLEPLLLFGAQTFLLTSPPLVPHNTLRIWATLPLACSWGRTLPPKPGLLMCTLEMGWHIAKTLTPWL